jgi:hypothetical protein
VNLVRNHVVQLNHVHHTNCCSLLKRFTGAADNEEEETYLDESDDIGEIDDGMSVQDIDEVEEIKEDA